MSASGLLTADHEDIDGPILVTNSTKTPAAAERKRSHSTSSDPDIHNSSLSSTKQDHHSQRHRQHSQSVSVSGHHLPDDPIRSDSDDYKIDIPSIRSSSSRLEAYPSPSSTTSAASSQHAVNVLANVEVLTDEHHFGVLGDIPDGGSPREDSDIRVRLPSHTVPFTQQASQKPFEMFMDQLLSMGYPYQECELALTFCNCRSIEEAIDFLTLSPDAALDIRHMFTPMDVQPRPVPPHREDEIEEQSERRRRLEERGGIDENEATSDENLNDDSNNSGMVEHRTVCAICGLEEPYHHRGEESQVFSLDDMEISRDPIVAQRQRRIQFEARMMKQREALAKTEEAKDEKEVAYDGPTIFCEICLEDRPEEEFFTGKCKHGFCQPCLRQHYQVQICDANVLDLTCMHFGCDRKVKEEEILLHFKDDVTMLKKYEKFKRNALLARNKNCRWCPKPGCETPMIGHARKPRLECPECKSVICFNCNQEWHPHKKCDQIIDDKYNKWAKGKDIQLCPKCKARVWKNMGCNHMTCPSCRHQFCWLCRGRYRSENHFAPWNFLGCPGRQFAFESGSRPNIIMRSLWRIGIFLVVIILGSLSVGVGSVALGVVIAAAIVCCPCIVVVQVHKYRKRRRREQNLEEERRNRRAFQDERRESLRRASVSSLPAQTYERREIQDYWSHHHILQPNIREIDGVLQVMDEEGNYVDMNSYERDHFMTTVEGMGFERDHILQAAQQTGFIISQAVEWMLEHPYQPPPGGGRAADSISPPGSDDLDMIQGDRQEQEDIEEREMMVEREVNIASDVELRHPDEVGMDY